MSYNYWPVHEFMMPATLENAKKLGLDEVDLYTETGYGPRQTDPDKEDYQDEDCYWDDLLRELGYESCTLIGNIDGKPITVYCQHIGDLVEADEKMNTYTDTYFMFNFSALFTKTPLYSKLEELGMAEYWYVDGG
jgi:hypothetical protein